MATPHAEPHRRATIRFFAHLGDHLSPRKRGVAFEHTFTGAPTAKEIIEALGVPYADVDLVLVNGRAEASRYRLRDGDRIRVYPLLGAVDVIGPPRLPPPRLDEPSFVLDVHLGRLSRYLRLLGFDTTLDPDLDDPALADLAAEEGRILLTRDRDLLAEGKVAHGYLVRASDSRDQLREVVADLGLARLARPFSRCMACNGHLSIADSQTLEERRPMQTRGEQDDDLQVCAACGQLYWRGSHFQHMRELVTEVVGEGWAG